MRDGWKLESLGSIAEFRGGGTPSTDIARYWGGDIPWVSPKDMKSDEIESSIDTITAEAVENSTTSLIPRGSILIVVRSGILARTVPTAITTREVAVNQDIKALCPRRTVDHRFLHYFVRGAERKILKLVTRGATVHRLSTDSLRALAIPIPSLPEQKRIVAILDEAFEGIDTAIANIEKNLANARELYDSHLNSIFSHNRRGWVEQPLSALVEIKHGFAFKSEHFTSKGKYVLLTPGNFYEEGGYRDRAEKQKFYVGEIPDGYILDRGDFLIAMTEQAAGLLGSSIIVPEDNKFLHNQRLGRVSIKPGVSWCHRFFFHAFKTKSFRKAVHDGASGVKVRHTSPNKLGLVKVRYPLSISEQEQVAGSLDKILLESKRLAGLYEAKLNDLAHLKQSILNKAFAGELTAQPEKALQEAAE